MTARRLAAPALACAATALLAAAPQQAVYRAEANYVEIYATVVDRQGAFVGGLTAGDFDIRENGARQSLVTFSEVDLPRQAAGAASATAPRYRADLPADRRVADGRLYLLYLNPIDARYVTDTRRLATEFVRDFLLPGDLAAVWDPGLPAREVAFTDDKAALAGAIEPFLGTSVSGEGLLAEGLGCTPGSVAQLPPGPRERCEAALRDPVAQLRQAVDWLRAIQGRRKSIVLFAGGWLAHANPVFQIDLQVYAFDVRGLVPPMAGHLANPPRTSDVVQLNQLIHEEQRALAQSIDGLHSLAEETGGFAVANRNQFRAGFARLVDANSRYYVLGYYAPPRAGRPAYREVDVRVARRDATVHARRGYYAR